MPTATAEPRHWTREEYDRLVEQGFFHPDEKIELLNGVIHDMTPQSSRHAAAVLLTQRALYPLYSEGFTLRVQMPLALDPDSEPEPDLAVVAGHPQDHVTAHPGTALLVVEVADSSLPHDRRKAALYARAGIPELWVLDLGKRRLEVYRDPRDGTYTSRLVLVEGDSVSPRTHPTVLIPVATLLPRT